MPSNTPYGLHEYAGSDIAATTLEDPTNAAALDAAAGHVGQQNTRTGSEIVIYSSNTVTPTGTGGIYASSGPASAILLNASGVMSLVATPSGTNGTAFLWGASGFSVSPTNLTTTPSAQLTVGTISALTYLGLPQQVITPTTQVLPTGSGTYNTPAGTRVLWVRAVGGGGGGGAATSPGGGNTSNGGGGGGSGGYVEAWITSPVSNYVYAVGTGGAGGTDSPLATGQPGNTTTFGPNITAGGGGGGNTIGFGASGGGGGSATLTGIGLTVAGGPGGSGANSVQVGATQGIAGALGGASVFSGSGAGGNISNGNGASAVNGSGSGGGGGIAISGTSGTGPSHGVGQGGNGGSGTIIVVAF